MLNMVLNFVLSTRKNDNQRRRSLKLIHIFFPMNGNPSDRERSSSNYKSSLKENCNAAAAASAATAAGELEFLNNVSFPWRLFCYFFIIFYSV